jgi:4-carboxymuconolactone decarboxylase
MSTSSKSPFTLEDIRKVSPALANYTLTSIEDNLWQRPGLNRRDRSIVTASALIARNQTVSMPNYFNRALDSGVKPGELSEIITHLAFYAGWPNALAAVLVARDIFAERAIGEDQLPEVAPKLLQIDQAAEDRRAAAVEQGTGAVSPGLVQFTRDPLFLDLWLRPALAPRDRSLVTVSVLIANEQSAQMPFHLNRAMDNGLNREEAGELIAHIAFYSGWPTAFSAVPVVKEVLEKRQEAVSSGKR